MKSWIFSASNLCSGSWMFVLTTALFASNSVKCALARAENASPWPARPMVSTSHPLQRGSKAVDFRPLHTVQGCQCRLQLGHSSAAVTFPDRSPNGRMPDVLATGEFGFGWRGTLPSTD